MKSAYNELKNVDIKTINPDSLVDISTVVINERLSKEEKLQSYIEQIRNPYCFKCGDIVVKVSFSENGETLEKLMENLILSY